MRARIALRKRGLLPVDDKKAEEDLVDTEVQNVRENRGIALSEEEVISAICRGDESIDLVRMTCVKYDHVFANDIARQFPNYHNLLAASKQKKGLQSKSSTPCKSRQQSVKKHESPAPWLLSPSPGEVCHHTKSLQQEQASRRYPERARRQSTRARISYALDESSDERAVSSDEFSLSK
ncbi:hypothetical protein CPC08DRAFT_761565 [Agrocybe pediades]|nr:hypothetical protein CPC08DRAFT_761565 [Agrocybe pediades]